VKITGSYPRLRVDTSPTAAIGQAGGVLLTRTVTATALDRFLSSALAGWRKPLAIHDPGKIITDLALNLALGGGCLADLVVLRAEPGVYGRVASDPAVSRAIAALAADAPAVLKAIDTARTAARQRAWQLAGRHAPDHGTDAKHPLIIDLDATLVTSHSEKEHAAPTFKRGFGFHPLCAFLDHGPDGTGETLAILLRPGNAGSNTATDHITVIRQALAQLPGHRLGRRVLIRTDGAGGAKALIEWLTRRRLSYSVGFTLPVNTPDLLAKIPDSAWTSAYDAHDQVRDGAWVADLTGLMNLDAWPAGMRVIVRKGTPPPGRAAPLRRRRRDADHRLRHQHPPRTTPRPRTAPPAPGPLRGPDPDRESITGLVNLPLIRKPTSLISTRHCSGEFGGAARRIHDGPDS
jgi:Transposase DDE domain group 1